MTNAEMVLQFHKVMGQCIGKEPGFPDKKERVLRTNLLQEEYQEYLTAEQDNNIVEIADALADMMYIIYGTATSYVIPLDEIFTEVHRSNMTKLDPITGLPMRRLLDGKIIKPSTYEAPKIREIILRHQQG